VNLSNLERVLKLCGSLARYPDLLLPWVRTSVLSRRLPLSYPYPWWSFKAIEAADLLIPGKSVFEYGTGGSTIRFARCAARMRSVEDDLGWLRLVETELRRNGIGNVELLHRPFDFRQPVGFEESAYLKAIGDEPWDVVIIDGQDWTFNERITCFEYAEPRMRQGGVLILDDYWRYTKLGRRSRATRVEIFESVGPCRIGVTNTAFFYY
jgi:hypothetical protein